MAGPYTYEHENEFPDYSQMDDASIAGAINTGIRDKWDLVVSEDITAGEFLDWIIEWHQRDCGYCEENASPNNAPVVVGVPQDVDRPPTS